ncbi:MAG: hypothetical protein H8K10_10690 [Nitrospira sp.]|nr:hypothetical protein [Nitrospira sp.]
MENGTQLLSKDAILAADDILTETVYVPEWKGSVIVCGLTGAAKDAYDKSIVEVKGNKRTVNLDHVRAKLLVRTLVNEQRQPLFLESDIIRLGTKSAAVLDRLCAIAQRLSGMRAEDAEELKKTSETTQNADSDSALPSA